MFFFVKFPVLVWNWDFELKMFANFYWSLAWCYLILCCFSRYVHSNGLNNWSQQTKTSFCTHAWSSTNNCYIYIIYIIYIERERDLLMEQILHQLMVVYPTIYKILHIPGAAGFLQSKVGICLSSLHTLLFCLLIRPTKQLLIFHEPFSASKNPMEKSNSAHPNSATFLYIFPKKNNFLVGGFNPFEKYARHKWDKMGIFPKYGSKSKHIWNQHLASFLNWTCDEKIALAFVPVPKPFHLDRAPDASVGPWCRGWGWPCFRLDRPRFRWRSRLNYPWLLQQRSRRKSRYPKIGLKKSWRLTWNTIMKVWFRWFSFVNGWFSGPTSR